jgi:hypothetical protein
VAGHRRRVRAWSVDFTAGKAQVRARRTTPTANNYATLHPSRVQDDGRHRQRGVDLDQSANTLTIHNVTRFGINDAPAGNRTTRSPCSRTTTYTFAGRRRLWLQRSQRQT